MSTTMSMTMSTTTTATITRRGGRRETAARSQAARRLGALALTAWLAGCSGGDDGSSSGAAAAAAEAGMVPTLALTTSRAYSGYVGSLAATEGGDPLHVDAAWVAPSSETEQPVAVR